jgi:hypothetical protein
MRTIKSLRGKLLALPAAIALPVLALAQSITPGGSGGGGNVAISSSLPAGSNAIGTVGVTALPPLPAGSNAIGTVGVTALPALVAGSAIVGKVGIDQTTVGTTNAVALAQVGSTSVVTGGTNGTIGIGGAVATNGTISGAKPVNMGGEATSAQPAAATSGNLRQQILSLDGAQYTRVGGPVQWACSLGGVAATLTQCQAAPGASLRLYVTDIVVQGTTSTAGTWNLQSGTGTNCGTGTAALYPKASATTYWTGPTNAQAAQFMTLQTPIAVPANAALCVYGAATNTTNIEIHGYTAP